MDRNGRSSGFTALRICRTNPSGQTPGDITCRKAKTISCNEEAFESTLWVTTPSVFKARISPSNNNMRPSRLVYMWFAVLIDCLGALLCRPPRLRSRHRRSALSATGRGSRRPGRRNSWRAWCLGQWDATNIVCFCCYDHCCKYLV